MGDWVRGKMERDKRFRRKVEGIKDKTYKQKICPLHFLTSSKIALAIFSLPCSDGSIGVA